MANPTTITQNGPVAEAVTNSGYSKISVAGELAGGVLTVAAVVGSDEIPCARITEPGLYRAADISSDWSISSFRLQVEGARTTGANPLNVTVTFS